MLGWGRHTKDPQKFANMVNNLNRLDLNILMMDYDNNVGFGDYKTIDICIVYNTIFMVVG